MEFNFCETIAITKRNQPKDNDAKVSPPTTATVAILYITCSKSTQVCRRHRCRARPYIRRGKNGRKVSDFGAQIHVITSFDRSINIKSKTLQIYYTYISIYAYLYLYILRLRIRKTTKLSLSFIVPARLMER